MGAFQGILHIMWPIDDVAPAHGEVQVFLGNGSVASGFFAMHDMIGSCSLDKGRTYPFQGVYMYGDHGNASVYVTALAPIIDQEQGIPRYSYADDPLSAEHQTVVSEYRQPSRNVTGDFGIDRNDAFVHMLFVETISRSPIDYRIAWTNQPPTIRSAESVFSYDRSDFSYDAGAGIGPVGGGSSANLAIEPASSGEYLWLAAGVPDVSAAGGGVMQVTQPDGTDITIEGNHVFSPARTMPGEYRFHAESLSEAGSQAPVVFGGSWNRAC